jgi:ribonuclease HI
MSDVEIVIDGSCLGNPGPGGWACILRCGDNKRVLQGGAPETTNNRMELTAINEGLRALNRACRVTVLTDSDYVRRGITEFLPRWKENGWRNSARKPVANQDLWEQLEELAEYHVLTWLHVRGHSGQPEQERCDALATAAARKVKEVPDIFRSHLPAPPREDRRPRTGRASATADNRPAAR